MVTGASTADARRHPDRRAQGRAHPDAAAQLHRLAARHPARRRWPSTRWTWSATRRTCFREIEDDYREFAAGIGLEDVTCIPVSALRGDNVARTQRADALVHGPTLLDYLERVEVDQQRMERRRRSACRCSSVNRPDLDFRGFAGHDRRAARSGRATASASLPSGRESSGRADRHLRRRSRRGRGRPVGHPHARRRDRRQPRRRARPRRGAAGVADQFEAHDRLDERGAAAARPPLPDEARRPSSPPPRSRRSSTRSTSTPWSTSPPARSSSTRSASATLQLDRPVAFDPYAAEPRHRRLHPHRPADQRHRRRRA